MKTSFLSNTTVSAFEPDPVNLVVYSDKHVFVCPVANSLGYPGEMQIFGYFSSSGFLKGLSNFKSIVNNEISNEKARRFEPAVQGHAGYRAVLDLFLEGSISFGQIAEGVSFYASYGQPFTFLSSPLPAKYHDNTPHEEAINLINAINYSAGALFSLAWLYAYMTNANYLSMVWNDPAYRYCNINGQIVLPVVTWPAPNDPNKNLQVRDSTWQEKLSIAADMDAIKQYRQFASSVYNAGIQEKAQISSSDWLKNVQSDVASISAAIVPPVVSPAVISIMAPASLPKPKAVVPNIVAVAPVAMPVDKGGSASASAISAMNTFLNTSSTAGQVVDTTKKINPLIWLGLAGLAIFIIKKRGKK